MNLVWIYSLLSVLIVSLVSLVGVLTLGIKIENLRKILIYFISFSAGALFGDAFFHLLPQLTKNGFTFLISSFILVGILIFFSLEKIVHWQHCHMPITKTHVHPFAYMNLVGDSLHNFIDGIIIASSYIISIPVGIATSIAVFLHEIPHEMGNFGILVHGGFSKAKALLLNFLTALCSFLGVLIVFFLNNKIANIEIIFTSIAVGGFIYIAGSDLIPELHKESQIKTSLLQILFFVLGAAILAALLLLE